MSALKPKFIPVYHSLLEQWYGLVEACIVWYIDFYQNDNRDFYCTNEELAELLCVWHATIERAIKNLNERWVIVITRSMREWWWILRKISLWDNEDLQTLNLSVCKTSKWGSYINNKQEKKSKKEKTDAPSIDELVEAYRNDDRINTLFLEEDLIDWLMFKRWRKEYYATTKSFITQMVVVKNMITNWKPQLDIPKRFNFAVNYAISYWWKWIHRDEGTEKQYLASKKNLFKTP